MPPHPSPIPLPLTALLILASLSAVLASPVPVADTFPHHPGPPFPNEINAEIAAAQQAARQKACDAQPVHDANAPMIVAAGGCSLRIAGGDVRYFRGE